MTFKHSMPRGFTLIELMVVVAIIGVIANIALPQYRNYVAKAEVGTAVSNAAGEKIKVAEAVNAGASNPCNGVAACAVAGSAVTLTGRYPTSAPSDAAATTVVNLTVQDTAASPLTWVCTVVKSPVGNYRDDPCDKLES